MLCLSRGICGELNEDFFRCFVEEFVELVHVDLAVHGVLVVGFQIELLLREFVLVDKKADACVEEVEQLLRGCLAIGLRTA